MRITGHSSIAQKKWQRKRKEKIMDIEFKAFPKIARLSREVIITEKIDGTNAQVFITENGDMFCGSRSGWITPEKDNYGFAAWATENQEALLRLGPGRHYGEWWGRGIQRGYGLEERRFSLFNVERWRLPGETPKRIPKEDPRIVEYQEVLPEGIGLVPVLARGLFDTALVNEAMEALWRYGSFAAPGYMNPEGIICFHIAGNVAFKKTFEKDSMPKALAKGGS